MDYRSKTPSLVGSRQSVYSTASTAHVIRQGQKGKYSNSHKKGRVTLKTKDLKFHQTT